MSSSPTFGLEPTLKQQKHQNRCPLEKGLVAGLQEGDWKVSLGPLALDRQVLEDWWDVPEVEPGGGRGPVKSAGHEETVQSKKECS